MTIPLRYESEGEGILSTFDSFDITTGIGIENFYGYSISGSYYLTTQIPYSFPIDSFKTFGGSTSYPTLAQEINFDTTFQKPLIMLGTAIISIPIDLYPAQANNTQMRCDVALYRVRNAVETYIISGSTAMIGTANTSLTVNEQILTITLNVPKTTFRKGDILRMELLQFGGTSAAGGATFAVGHDPKNRAGGTITTIDTNLIASLPFKIDL